MSAVLKLPNQTILSLWYPKYLFVVLWLISFIVKYLRSPSNNYHTFCQIYFQIPKHWDSQLFQIISLLWQIFNYFFYFLINTLSCFHPFTMKYSDIIILSFFLFILLSLCDILQLMFYGTGLWQLSFTKTCVMLSPITHGLLTLWP